MAQTPCIRRLNAAASLKHFDGIPDADEAAGEYIAPDTATIDQWFHHRLTDESFQVAAGVAQPYDVQHHRTDLQFFSYESAGL